MKFLIGSLILALTTGAFANEHKSDAGEDMAKMITLTAVSENHAILKDLVGRWKTSSKFWMDKNSKPEEASGTQVNKLIMDGRFLQSEAKGTAMGKPFTGMGLLGYDNIKSEYQSMWIDNMNTSLMTSSGSFDGASKTLNEKGTGSCPMTGEKNRVFRGEWRFVDKKNYVYSLYSNGKDGAEYKMMEITYKKN